jgi:hypothetical protein
LGIVVFRVEGSCHALLRMRAVDPDTRDKFRAKAQETIHNRQDRTDKRHQTRDTRQ